MDTLVRGIRIEHLRARVELCRIACAALEREYYAGGQSVNEMAEIAKRWGEALKLGNAARVELAGWMWSKLARAERPAQCRLQMRREEAQCDSGALRCL